MLSFRYLQLIFFFLRFLYQGREVSYSAILDRSISARRQTLYEARKFDIEHWMDLVSEKKKLRAEIRRVEEDYEPSGREEEEGKVGEEDQVDEEGEPRPDEKGEQDGRRDEDVVAKGRKEK